MKYLHTMIRISNIQESLKFFCDGLGLKETKRMENEKGRYTLIFLAAPNDNNAEYLSVKKTKLGHMMMIILIPVILIHLYQFFLTENINLLI